VRRIMADVFAGPKSRAAAWSAKASSTPTRTLAAELPNFGRAAVSATTLPDNKAQLATAAPNAADAPLAVNFSS